MPINLFGNSFSSYDNDNKIDSSFDSGNKIDKNLFVQKPYLRTNYIEIYNEQDIDLKS